MPCEQGRGGWQAASFVASGAAGRAASGCQAARGGAGRAGWGAAPAGAAAPHLMASSSTSSAARCGQGAAPDSSSAHSATKSAPVTLPKMRDLRGAEGQAGWEEARRAGSEAGLQGSRSAGRWPCARRRGGGRQVGSCCCPPAAPRRRGPPPGQPRGLGRREGVLGLAHAAVVGAPVVHVACLHDLGEGRRGGRVMAALARRPVGRALGRLPRRRTGWTAAQAGAGGGARAPGAASAAGTPGARASGCPCIRRG
jgi:hypothetical protein